MHLELCSERILVFSISVNSNTKYAFANVYMPFDCADNYDDYLYNLGIIESLRDEINTYHFCVIGDFNASLDRGLFGRELVQFCSNNNLIISDVDALPDDSYTFLSSAWHTTSWIDHIVCSHMINDTISNIQVEYGLCTGDHFPICATFNVPSNLAQSVPSANPSSNLPSPQPQWSKATEADVLNYRNISSGIASQIQLPVDALLCRDAHCCMHNEAIDRFNTDIVDALRTVTARCIPSGRDVANMKNLQVPGWNDHLKDFYDASRSALLLWRRCGSPRDGPIAEMRRNARARFKLEQKRCKRHETSARNNSLAVNLANNDSRTLWKNLKRCVETKYLSPIKSAMRAHRRILPICS